MPGFHSAPSNHRAAEKSNIYFAQRVASDSQNANRSNCSRNWIPIESPFLSRRISVLIGDSITIDDDESKSGEKFLAAIIGPQLVAPVL